MYKDYSSKIKKNAINMASHRGSLILDHGPVKIDTQSFGDELKKINAEPSEIERCLTVLRAVEEMMAEMPEELMTGRSLGDHRAGNGEVFNLIPHDHNDGICHDILVAIARGSHNRRWGFRSVMRQVRSHLINCEYTKVVLLLTDSWDKERFRESQADLEAHMKRGTKIVAGLISKDQIRAMPLPF